MKTTPKSGLILPRLAILAGLLFWSGGATAATPYREETHGPRIGTRIVLFFKDLAFFDNPSDRYRHLPKNQPPAQPQQRTYGAQSPGQRYNLDHPPVVGSGMPQRQPQPLPAPQPTPNAASRDLPYASPDATPSDDREPFQAGIGGQQEALPQVTIKPKVASAPKPSAPAPTPKPVVESSPVPKTGSPAAPAPENKSAAQIASNAPASSNKPWQSPTSDSTATPPVPSTSTGTTPAGQPSGNTTLTGSKTSKDGRVKSPYPPFNELDVSGLPVGSLAMDPTTGKVFRVP